MNIGESVATAMKNIIAEDGRAITAIAKGLKVTYASFANITNGITKNASILTIHEFCCGTGYTLEEFFARKEFDDLE